MDNISNLAQHQLQNPVNTSHQVMLLVASAQLN